MFSGIVETLGNICFAAFESGYLKATIIPAIPFTDINIGDSISVNGACLTVTELVNDSFTVNIVPETLRLTNLCDLKTGGSVNLERSIKIGDRISGHYVQGHVDATCDIIDVKKDGEGASLLTIAIPSSLEKYIVKKGYIALDGMSLTVIDITDDYFTVTLIPHTKQVTVAKHYQIGTKVNIEVDMLGKYVEKLVRRQ